MRHHLGNISYRSCSAAAAWAVGRSLNGSGSNPARWRPPPLRPPRWCSPRRGPVAPCWSPWPSTGPPVASGPGAHAHPARRRRAAVRAGPRRAAAGDLTPGAAGRRSAPGDQQPSNDGEGSSKLARRDRLDRRGVCVLDGVCSEVFRIRTAAMSSLLVKHSETAGGPRRGSRQARSSSRGYQSLPRPSGVVSRIVHNGDRSGASCGSCPGSAVPGPPS
jgi:hypothetical protein